MIDYEFASLFADDSVYKTWEIQVYNEAGTYISTIDNDDIYLEEFEHNSPLNTENTLRFGSCESSYVKFRVVSSVGTLKGKKLKIYVTPDSGDPLHPATALQVGEFYVDSDNLSDDRDSREIIAYDAIYKIINTNMKNWYDNVGLPRPMSEFRTEFFNFFGITQVSATLCNDDMPVVYRNDINSLSGLDVLSSILAVNGCLGTIDHEGKFKYIVLDDRNEPDVNYDYEYKQGSLIYEDYIVKAIDELIILVDGKETMYVNNLPGQARGTNPYVLNDFLFFPTIHEDDLEVYARNLLAVIIHASYRPLKAETYGNPCVEVGDIISFTSLDGNSYSTIVLNKVEKGLIALSDSFETTGTEDAEYDINRYSTNGLPGGGDPNARCYVYSARPGRAEINSASATTILVIPIASTDDTKPVFLATIPLEMDRDGEITFRYFLDDVEINPNDNDTIYLTEGEQFVTLSTFFEIEANQNKRFSVTAQTGYRESVERQQTAKIISLKDWIDNQSITVDTQTGTATFNYDYVEHPIDTTPPSAVIAVGKARAMIFASGLASEQPWDGTIVMTEVFSNWNLAETGFANASETLTVTPQIPIPIGPSDSSSAWNLAELLFESALENITIETHTDSKQLITESGVTIVTENDYVLYTEGD